MADLLYGVQNIMHLKKCTILSLSIVTDGTSYYIKCNYNFRNNLQCNFCGITNPGNAKTTFPRS